MVQICTTKQKTDFVFLKNKKNANMRRFNFPLLLLQKHRCQQSQSRAPHGCESNVVSKTGTPMSSPLRSPIEYVTETPAAFTPDELARVPQHILNRLRQLAATVSTALEEENYRRQHQSVHSSDHILPPASRALLIADSRRLLYNALQDDHPHPELSDARILALALLHLHRQARVYRWAYEETVKYFFDCVCHKYPVIEELLDRIIADPHVPEPLPPELLTDLQFAVLRWGGLRGVLAIPHTFHDNVNQDPLTARLTAA